MSTVTLVKPAMLSRSAPILFELLRVPKGKGNIFYVDGSEELSLLHTNKRKTQLRHMVRAMDVPYVIHFYGAHTGLVGFWSFDDEFLLDTKHFFDLNAERGIYPEVYQWKGR